MEKKILMGIFILFSLAFIMFGLVDASSSVGCTGKTSDRCEVYASNGTCIKHYSDDVPVCPDYVQASNIQTTLSEAMPSSGTTTITGGASVQLEKTSTKFNLEDKVISANTAKELSVNETAKVQNETDLIQPLLQKISELEERIKFLEEQLNKTQIQENKTDFSITGNVVSNFENGANIPFWNRLKNLFRRNE